jgi:hypothetical protein
VSLAAAVGTLCSALDRLAIRYAVVGSVASSARGIFRATNDVDLLVQIHPAVCERLASDLGADWYVDVPLIRDALRIGRGFNLIFIPFAEKFDFFPVSDEFQRTEIERATVEKVKFADGIVQCRVASAEDILLAKLKWYRQGGEVSERQWSDILGVINTNSSLDSAYLAHWASNLGVTDLLARAGRDASA